MSKNKKRGTVRIIGGKWRSRRLSFADLTELRPTTDRIRETVFNWLNPYLPEAVCLDLFAGSGALGFEALSRGAKSVVMVDQAKEVIAQLQRNAELLQAKDLDLYQMRLPPDSELLQQYCFDIIFLDPPFHRELIGPCCAWIESNLQLAENALLYLEAEEELDPLPISPRWEIIRSKKTGKVGYHLLKFLGVKKALS
jgi:16S rRNA (guanine966-N2)-methyltransferase